MYKSVTYLSVIGTNKYLRVSGGGLTVLAGFKAPLLEWYSVATELLPWQF